MKYEVAQMDIVKFNTEDVITTSGETLPNQTPIG